MTIGRANKLKINRVFKILEGMKGQGGLPGLHRPTSRFKEVFGTVNPILIKKMRKINRIISLEFRHWTSDVRHQTSTSCRV
jgi:hypothetical protein